MSTVSRRLGLMSAGATALGLALFSGFARAQPAPPLIPANEWPDPNFYIEDASGVVPAINDALSGPIPPIRVLGYTTGARDVTVRVASTADLAVGQYVSFAAPCDPALRATPLQIRAIAAGRSFDATLEFPSGVPAASTPCEATLIQHGDATGLAGGGAVTSNVIRYGDGRLYPHFWISSRPAHVALLQGGEHVLVVVKATAGPEFIGRNAIGPNAMAGARRAVGAAIVVASGEGAAARAYISDGAIHTGPAVATARTRTWVSAQADVPAHDGAYQEGVLLTGPVGSTFVLGEFESVPSAGLLPDHSFSVPVRQTVMALASISPYVGVKFTLPRSGSFDVNLGQASDLAITGGVTLMIGNLEGEASTFPTGLSTASPRSPVIFGPMLHQVLDTTGHAGDPRYYAFASGEWPVRDNHFVTYGAPGVTWSYVSWDLLGFVLLAGP